MSISVSNLNFNRGTTPILANISFNLEASESLGIIGPNGGGKSTLLNILAGALYPSSGEMIIDGVKIKKESQFPYEKIAYVPQHTELDCTLPLNVYDFIHFGLLGKKNTNPKSADQVMELTGISKKRNSLLNELSGGERQRVLISKALISNPKILILDEPTTGLDTNGEDQLLSLLEDVQKNTKTTLIVVDHNIAQVINFCDKILCLNKTHHWHQNKELLTTSVLGSIYHCEFEHLVLHQKTPDENNRHSHHKFCEGADHKHTHNNLAPPKNIKKDQ